jgi:hypothetical protein
VVGVVLGVTPETVVMQAINLLFLREPVRAAAAVVVVEVKVLVLHKLRAAAAAV